MKLVRRLIGIVTALGMLGLVMGYLAGFFEDKLATEPVTLSEEEFQGQIITVEAVMEPVIEQATGTVHAKQETVISARIMATIATIPVRAGDAVKQGDELVMLDSRELEARLEQQRQQVAVAEAKLSEAESNYRRIEPLAGRGVATKAELDRAEAALRSAEAELARARQATEEGATALSYGVIAAPFAGRVIERFADPGDTATPGEPLLKIYNPEHLRLEANVRESLASRLTRGDGLSVRIDALDAEFAATVDEIVPSADPGSRSFVVKVSLPVRANLYPGMFGRMLIPAGTTERFYIPGEAVARLGQLEFVKVPQGGRVVRRYIRTGESKEDGRVEVLSGLRAGETLLLSSGLES
jgi:RND family efflux transporter MFP subunit